MSRRRIYFLLPCALLILLLLLLGLWGWAAFSPAPSLLDGIAFSPLVLDGQGQPLRVGLSRDGMYRIFTPLREVAPETVRAALIYEDRYFYHHPGVNPLSLARAVWHMALGGRRMGGSTITMQVARLRHGLVTATFGGKLHQLLLALRLECHYSKDALLEAYINLAPYGGNVEGVGAASRVYFHSAPERLTPAQSLALASIPQNPSRRGPQARGNGHFDAARQRMHALWRLNVQPDMPDAPPLRVYGPGDLPFGAPHLCAEILALVGEDQSPTHSPLRTFIDPDLQSTAEAVLRGFTARGRAFGLHNAAALLLHWPSMEVRALVGSSDFHMTAIQGQVDGTRARRSPGSTLKPFIYALALDQGIIHAQTLLPDAPRSFGGYNPENFDRHFRGPLPAHEALRASRNLPAVWLASRLRPGLYELLERAGVALAHGPEHYGLALVLGGAAVSMREVAGLYAMLAHGGVWRAPRRHAHEPHGPGLPLLSPEAAHVTLRMLEGPRHVLRSREGDVLLRLKTGTSNGFRDAWAAGVVGPYVLVVWAGNFDNTPHPLLVGGEVAAPLFEDIVRAVSLTRSRQDTASPDGLRDRVAPQAGALNLTRLSVCAETGDVDVSLCPGATSETWYIPGRSPTRASGIYRRIAIDEETGLRACPAAGSPVRPVREEVWEFWPSDLRALYARAGLVKAQPPPFAPWCAGAETPGQPPRILTPKAGVGYVRRLSDPARGAVPLNAGADADVRVIFWFEGGRYLGQTAPGEVLLWQPGDGPRHLRAVDDQGRASALAVDVRTVP